MTEAPRRRGADSVSRLVELALNEHQLSGFTRMLKCIAEECDADGVVLWELNEVDPSVNNHRDFFTLAQWFPENTIWPDPMPIESACGHAVLNDLPFHSIRDVQDAKEPHIHRGPFLLKVRSMCIVPVTFVDKGRGALAACRLQVRPFTESEIRRMRQMADLLPRLYETVRDEVAFKLSRELNECLQSSNLDTSEDHTENDLRNLIQKICRLIGQRLEVCELSIFLSTPDHPNEFLLYGSTLDFECPHSPTRLYSFDEKDLTAATLNPSNSSIRVLDLKRSTLNPPIKADPVYVEWISSFAGERPLSFMATPILVGSAIIGVMRCCALNAGPTFFAEREEALFKLLAGQIGQYVSSQRGRWALKLENSEWRVLVRSISDIVTLVHKELSQNQSDEKQIYISSLKMIEEVIPGATFVDIRIHNEHTGQMEQGTSHGWTRYSGREATLPTEWLKMVQKDTVIDLTKESLSNSQYNSYLNSVPHKLERLVIAPIRSNDQLGILEIGQSGKQEFPKHAPIIAKLLGEQLSLYHSFAFTRAELNKKINKEEEMRRAQNQTFMDLEHQIKTPLRHARVRIPIALRIAEGHENEPIQKQLLFLRGILRRASRVAASIGLYAELASQQPIRINKKSLSVADLRKLMLEAMMDSQLLVDEKKAITFGFDDELFYSTPKSTKFDVDTDLLDQAINNLLDNAAKYSFPASHVKITVTTTKARACISVINRGLHLGHESVERAKERGWRSPLAKLTTGEGTGIGLWIVNHIMKAHSGELLIIPTTPKGVTDIRLLFPLSKD